MRTIVLLVLGSFLLSCKVKLASFNPSSSEKYLRNEKIVHFEDRTPVSVSPISEYSEYTVETDKDTTYRTGHKQITKKADLTMLLPVDLTLNDSIPPKKIIEPVGILSGAAGLVSVTGLLSRRHFENNRTMLLFIILGILAALAGVISFFRIGKNRKKYKGFAGPIIGIITSSPALFLTVFAIVYSCST